MNAESQNNVPVALKANQKGEQGFTLIETAIGMVLMMVVGLGAASLFVYAVGSNSGARDRALSMAVAQQEMELLRNTSYATIETRVAATGGSNKTVSSAGRQYDVATTVTVNSTTKTITIQVVPRGTNTAGMSATQRIFGGVTLVTQRAADSLGVYRN